MGRYDPHARQKERPIPTDLTLREKFILMRQTLGATLVDRYDVIETMVLALASGKHMFQLSKPGTAKSMAIRRMVSLIEMPKEWFFHIQLNGFTNDQEIFGPLDLMALGDPTGSRYKYMTDMYLPTARIAMIDEIYKASSTMLNALLLILLEREFKNDRVMEQVPLHSMFCASNELPEGVELAAIADRVHLWVPVDERMEPGVFKQMLVASRVKWQPHPILTFDEIQQAKKEVGQVEINGDIDDMLTQVRLELGREGIHPSPRRFVESMDIIRAAAWLDGEKVATIDHLRPLRFMFWQTKEEFPTAERICLELSSPLDAAAMKVSEGIDNIYAQLERITQDDLDRDARNDIALELEDQIDKAERDLKLLQKEEAEGSRKSIEIEKAESKLAMVNREMLKKIYDVTPEEMAALKADED